VTPEQMTKLREPFPDSEIGKLPRIWCAKCRDAQGKVCSDHSKSKCQVCANNITNAHLHLDYVGHAELTDRLLDVDPEWSWEPANWSPEGEPVISKHGNNLVMWGRLTILGVTRLGVGTAPANKDDAHKELIGDFLRNAAMRFGVALDLWRKSEKAEAEHHEEPPPAADAGTHEAIRSIVANLTEPQAKVLAAWWKQQHLPSIKSGDVLTQAQAEAVLNHLDTLEEAA
jgi:hypothetical protein